MPPEGGGGDTVASFLDGHLPALVERLAAWVAIPSVAADPDRSDDVLRSAHWLAGEMRDIGLTTEILPTGDAAAVYGELRADADAPTVLIYSHHDVRDAKPEQWRETEPFTAVERDGRLYGRGASDAKGQVLAHLAGLRAHLASRADGTPAVNLRFLVEGEEEIGSPNLRELIESDPERFACDLIVFSDTVQWREDAPAPVTSMRGVVTASLTVTGPSRDVHSGVASGVTVNPAHVVADVVSSLHDDHGRIRLPRFYDDVEELTAERRADFARLPTDEDEWMERVETSAVDGEEGYTLVERLWARPSVEIISLLAGDPLGMERSVIPETAEASFSFRIVPGQSVHTVADQLREFVASVIPEHVDYTLEVDEIIAQQPYTTPAGPAADALERALERGYGVPLAGRMGNAGGGPADYLGQTLGAPVILIGTGLPEDHWHASDESVSLTMLHRGAATIAHLWEELGSALRGGRQD
ncbi:M20/M25/M40 family metallo-hydrolase [Microbacterium sp. 3J1]|uniref:M20/M25/M40 family metallo-hydrolase n=1 Tax=Microbacterium sp. 3J1 TaxID=861269 RepID=UPI000A8CA0C6|nr:M20/M25/M40 family metallo-hydrolase [Microbacterium sp. 3J1]